MFGLRAVPGVPGRGAGRGQTLHRWGLPVGAGNPGVGFATGVLDVGRRRGLAAGGGAVGVGLDRLGQRGGAGLGLGQLVEPGERAAEPLLGDLQDLLGLSDAGG